MSATERRKGATGELEVFRRSRSPWLAVLELDELMALLRLRDLP